MYRAINEFGEGREGFSCVGSYGWVLERGRGIVRCTELWIGI